MDNNFQIGLFITMPSAPTSRYKSRLFNFLHQKSQQLGDQLQIAFRHVKVTTSWSLEALLQPLYLLFQKAIDSSGKQLHSRDRQHQSKLQSETPLSTGTPIQLVLATVGKMVAGEERKLYRRSLSIPVVRGIASDLANRNLVLVTDENIILNILTRQQQEKLQNRITTEVANYCQNWQLTQVNEETKILSEIDSLLTKMTGSIPDKTPVLPQSMVTESRESTFNSASLLVAIDTIVTNLESKALVPVSHVTAIVQSQTSKLAQVIRLISQPRKVSGDTEDRTLKITALIWGAIHFFFGGRNDKSLKTGNQLLQQPTSFALPNSLPLQTEDLTDPWLTPSDLFGDSQQQSDACGGRSLRQFQVSSQNTNPLLPSQETKHSFQNFVSTSQRFWRKFPFRISLVPLGETKTKTDNLLQNHLLKTTTTEHFEAKFAEQKILSRELCEVTEEILNNQTDQPPQNTKSVEQNLLPPEKSVEFVRQPLLSRRLHESFVSFCLGKIKPQKLLLRSGKDSSFKITARHQVMTTTQSHEETNKLDIISDLTSTRKQGERKNILHLTTSLISKFKTESQKQESQLQQSPTNTVEGKPDWIEIKAKSLGYEKHPLEQVLQWLDRLMVLLEDIFLRIIHFLHQQWKR
ncbi:MAG: hypothetical protein PUP92_04295 [Rhizonema sp. PD38]|nr:hypothetical protein [Rhizonema sp. PD38]